MITLTQAYKAPKFLQSIAQITGLSNLGNLKGKLNIEALKSPFKSSKLSYDNKINKYYENSGNKGGLFSSTNLQLKNFTEGLKQAIASLNNFTQANNTAAKYSLYSGAESYTGGSRGSILDNYVTYDYSVASTTSSSYGFTSGNYINTSSS